MTVNEWGVIFSEYKQQYARTFKYIYPAKNSTGFPERNLSVNFIRGYETARKSENETILSWYEFQFGANNNQHVDAVLINKTLGRFVKRSLRRSLFYWKGGATMAATRLIALHIGKGKTAVKALQDRLDYSQNPNKTDDKKYVSSYECDPETAAEEFALSKAEYYRITGRTHEKEVIAYQIRQSFKPGEVTPEEANKVGYETAMRFTKGKHAFTVSTHIDRAHIHNHIIFNSTTLDCTHKFRNFLKSGLALEVVSNLVCLEYKLSVIRPVPGDMITRNKFDKRRTIRDQIRCDIDAILNGRAADFEEILQGLKDRGYEIKHGKHISVKGKNQKSYIRLASLGEGYSEADLRRIFFIMISAGGLKTP